MKLFPSFLKVFKPGTKTTSILISTLVFIIVVTIYNFEDRDLFKALRIFKAIEQKTMDVRFQIRGKRDPGDEIVIVAIDEKSIKKLGRYPWPRRYVAQLVDRITDTGARLLALDVMYTERQNVDILKALDTLTGKYNNSQLQNYIPGGQEKEKFLSALKKRRNDFDEDSRLQESFRRAVEDNGLDIISSIEFVDEEEVRSTEYEGKEVSGLGRELLKESAYFPVLVGAGSKTSKEKSSDGNTLTKIGRAHV